MSFRTFFITGIMSVVFATGAQAAPITFDADDLTGGAVAADFTEVTASVDGLNLTATATEGGAIRHYTQGGGKGLYIGAITSGAFNTNANTTAPASGRYALNFDQAVSTLTFSIDWLTDSSAGEEIISEFATEFGALILTSANYTPGTGTSFDPLTQEVTTTVGRGSGTFTYSSDQAFKSFSFFHDQAPRNIGFTITSVTADVAPVPLPAGFPLLLAGLGGFAYMRRRQTR